MEVYLTLDRNDSGYTGIAKEKIRLANAHIGDTIEVSSHRRTYTGTLMPRAQVGSDSDHLVLKLSNGYNIGIRLETDSVMKRVGSRQTNQSHATESLHPTGQTNLPTVAVLSTGGTIASRVDYQTGAVNPALSAEDLYNSVPELKEHANVRAKVVMSKLSENIHPADWTKIASAVASEIRKDSVGVVVAHGTDTMGFTAAALSFALQNLPVPVAIVGSQRSSDRPSSDASMNLIAATDLVAHANAAEVMVVMHAGTDDQLVHAHRGNKVRKLHTSRRDAFQSVNHSALYRVDSSGITELNAPLLRRDRSRKMQVKSNFDDQAVLLKTFPGMRDDLIRSVIDHGYKGIVVEGSGLGHTPTAILQALKSAIDAGMVVAMASQCIWGRVNMNVYRSGVELTEIGVVPCEDMLAETALVKMMWLLANSKGSEEVRRKMPVSLVGEIDTRTSMTAPTSCGGRFSDGQD